MDCKEILNGYFFSVSKRKYIGLIYLFTNLIICCGKKKGFIFVMDVTQNIRLSISDAFLKDFYFSTKVVLLRSSVKGFTSEKYNLYRKKVRYSKASEMLNLKSRTTLFSITNLNILLQLILKCLLQFIHFRFDNYLTIRIMTVQIIIILVIIFGF